MAKELLSASRNLPSPPRLRRGQARIDSSFGSDACWELYLLPEFLHDILCPLVATVPIFDRIRDIAGVKHRFEAHHLVLVLDVEISCRVFVCGLCVGQVRFLVTKASQLGRMAGRVKGERVRVHNERFASLPCVSLVFTLANSVKCLDMSVFRTADTTTFLNLL